MTTNTEENGMTTEDWSFYDEGYSQDAKGEDLLGDLKAIAEAPAASAYVLEAMDCSWLVLGPAGATEEQAQTALNTYLQEDES